VAAARCPVCDEALPDRPVTCFRCETPLQHWWALEESLPGDGVEAAPPVKPGRLAGATAAWVGLPALAAGAALGAILLGRPAPPAAAPVVPPATAPAVTAQASPAAPAVVRYRVQRGDSLWRVAAALTGDGDRWRELWPALDQKPGPLLPGTVLEVPADLTAAGR
jgi:5'-nucleotidase